MYKKFPDTIATFPFLTSGLFFGYLLFLPWIDSELYRIVSFWPHFALLFSIVITASMITIIKLNNGKYIFEHFTYLIVASVLYIIAGTLFAVLPDSYTYIGLFIGTIANGVVYVAGLSYVNIRAEKQERPMRIALCHAWKMIGFSIIFTIYLYLLDGNDIPSPDTVKKTNQVFGYITITSSVLFILLHFINEFRQRQGLVYNYKDCLDHDNAIANNYCKLFSKNEVVISQNATVSSAGLWKSTENLLPKSKENYTNLWTLFLLLPKLHGAVMFHYFLVAVTMVASRDYIEWGLSKAILVWMTAAGSIIGCGLLRYVGNAKVYTIASTLAIMFVAIGYAFFHMKKDILVIFLWLYFFSASIAVAVPDICLMEIAKVRFIEGALALGFFLEIIPIAVLQSTQYTVELRVDDFYNKKYFLPVIISTIVILVLTSLVNQLFMPNTYNKSLLQIQNELLKYKKFFVFTFDEDVGAPVSRSSSESTYTQNNNIVNVFEDHEKNMKNSSPNDYTEVNYRQPMYQNGKLSTNPPVNRVNDFDYDAVVPKPPQVIPRINLGTYGSQKNF